MKKIDKYTRILQISTIGLLVLALGVSAFRYSEIEQYFPNIPFLSSFEDSDFDEDVKVFEGKPEVVLALPQGTTDVHNKVVVTFNHSMTSLSSLDYDDSKDIPLEISPKVEGKFRWLGTSSISFTPEDRFAYATRYTVTIPHSTKNISGTALGEAYIFYFETPRAQVNQARVVYEANESERSSDLNGYPYMYEKQPIDIIFTQDIDIENMKNFIYLKREKNQEEYERLEGDDDLPMLEEVHEEDVDFVLTYKKAERERVKNTLVLIPKTNWDNQFSYRLIIKSGVKSLEGDLVYSNKVITSDIYNKGLEKKNKIKEEYLNLEKETGIQFDEDFIEERQEEALEKKNIMFKREKIFNFSPVPEFIVWSVNPKNEEIIKRSSQSYRSNSTEINMQFSSPLQESDFLKHINIQPDVDAFNIDSHVYFDGNESLYHDWWNLKPSTEYTVTISKDMPDRFGRILGEDYSWSFTTAPMEPSISLETKGKDFGVFESGVPPMYRINYVNIKKVDVSLAKLSLEDVLQMKLKKAENWDYTPHPSQYNVLKSWSFNIPDNTNAVTIQNLEIAEYLKSYDSGIFLLDVSSPEVKNYNKKIKHDTQIFSLTPYALTVKHSKDKVFVYASDIQTAEPLEKLKIELLNLKGKVQYRGVTNKKGITEISVDLKKFFVPGNDRGYEFFVRGTKKGNMVFVGSDWDDGIQPWKFSISTQYINPHDEQTRIAGKIYTDRPLYKPGETMYFKGMIRSLKQGSLGIPVKEDAVVIINNREGKEIFRKEYKISSFGGFDGEFQIPEDVQYGGFYIAANLKQSDEFFHDEIYNRFLVSHFEKAPFKINIETEQEEYVWGDTVKGNISAETFFGAKLSGQKVNFDVNSTDYYFNRYKGEWFSFSSVGNWCYWFCDRSNHYIFDEQKTLDAQGNSEFSFEIQSKEDESDPVKLSQVYIISASIWDEKSDKEVGGRKEIIAHFTDWYLGVKIDEYMIQKGEDVAFTTVSVDTDGAVKSKQKFKAELVQRAYKSIKKKGVDGEFYYENETKDEILDSKNIKTDENGKYKGSFSVEKGGSHIIRVTADDGKDHEIIAESEFWVSSRESVSWPKANHDRIDIIKDKQQYKVGDTAKLLIKSPYTQAKALVTIEQDSVIDSYTFNLESNAQSIEVEIKEEHIPNVYVSVILQKPRTSSGEYSKENRRDNGQPEFKIGYIKLPVEIAQKELDINITTHKDRYLPQEEVELNVEVKDFEGKGTETDLAIMVVDLSLLALTGYEQPDIVKEFYAERRLGVNTSLTFAKFIERFKPGSKGGGGGDENAKKRGEFKNTAYWVGSLTTDENGKAQTKFKLPDNLTTWKVTVIAQDKQHRFGSGDSEFLETKRLIINPSLPQFFNAGDEVEIKAVIINKQNKKIKSEVSLSVEGGEVLNHSKAIQITLKEDARETVIFTVKAGEAGEMNLKFSVQEKDGENKDILIEKRRVNRLVTEEVVATSGKVEKSQKELVFLPKAIIPDMGSLDISLSSTLAHLLPKNLQLLSTYPYSCTEQTVSRIFPNILVLENDLLKNIFPKDERKEIEKHITAGLTKIYETQAGDGSWGYFASAQNHRAYLTAYMLIALEEMQISGRKIDVDVLNKARDYMFQERNSYDIIQQGFVRWALSYSQGSSNDGEYARNILSGESVIQESKKGSQYSKKEYIETNLPSENKAQKIRDLPYFAYAYWALASQDVSILEPILEAVQQTDRGAFVEEKNGYQSYWSSNKRSTALTLYALQVLDPEHPYIPKLLRWLNNNRNHQGYGNTQENVWTLLALIRGVESAELEETDEAARVNIAKKEVLNVQFDGDKKIEEENKNEEKNNIFGPFEVAKSSTSLESIEKNKDVSVDFSQKGKGDLYYDMQLSYFVPVNNIKAREEGFSILRELYTMEGERLKTIPKVGETFKVKLTVVAPSEGNFVAIEDFVPAGVTPINTRFKTENQSLEEDLNQGAGKDWWRNATLRYFRHVEFRDDRVFLFAENLPAGVYEYEYAARVSHAGTFNYLPARVFEMYDEDRFGRTKGEEVVIER